MPITKFDFKPGINREATAYAEEGGWYDADKIRFRAGRPETIGGWQTASEDYYKGVCRVMMNWTLLDSSDCLALGTHKKFYIESSGVFHDVTPVRYTDTKTNPITTGAGASTLHTYTTTNPHGAAVGDYFVISGITADVDGICTDQYTNPFTTSTSSSKLVIVNTSDPHYAEAGDSVTFSGTTGFDGIPDGDFNTTHTILEVTSPSTFIIETATACTTGYTNGGGSVAGRYLARLNREFEVVSAPTSTTVTFNTDTVCSGGGVTGGGVGIVAKFQISIGYSINISGGGWGTGTWSRGTWGSPITSSVSGINMRLWSVDNYGEDIIFCTRDGPLFIWDATSGFTTRGTYIADDVSANQVPSQTSIVRVTDERHVLAIGTTDEATAAFDPLLIRWSHQEDFTDWEPRADNTAGFQRIPMGSYVVAALSARQETLIWTDHSLHSLQYSGPPYIFGLQTIAENTNIIGPNAAVNVNNVTYWMGRDRFWSYSGRVQTLPCTVQRYVFSRLNQIQAAQVYAAANDAFTEITWFYPSVDGTENDSYVTFNYHDNVWTIGSMARTAWTMCSGRNNLPYAATAGASDDGMLLVHEVGYSDGSTNPPSPIYSYIESADFDIGDGDRLLFLDQVIPDITFSRSTADSPSVTLSISGKKFPGQPQQSIDSRIVYKDATVDEHTKQVWMRLRARQLRIKLTSYATGVCWMLGALRANVRADGKQ